MQAATDCPNCAAPLPQDPPARHCPGCGQETALSPPSFGEFVREFVGQYVALEGALWRSLGLLLFRPGRLTLAYLRGRRRRYVLPLRLYLSASFVLFLAVKVFGLGVTQDTESMSQIDPQRRARLEVCAAGSAECGWMEQRASRLVLRSQAQPGAGPDMGALLNEQLTAWAPYAMFAMQPVFAGLMMLAWRQRQQTYGAHFVFSLHVHAFWFVAMLVGACLPPHLAEWMALVMAGYGLRAMQVVHEGRWWATLLRGTAALAGYGMLLATVLIAAVLWLLIS